MWVLAQMFKWFMYGLAIISIIVLMEVFYPMKDWLLTKIKNTRYWEDKAMLFILLAVISALFFPFIASAGVMGNLE